MAGRKEYEADLDAEIRHHMELYAEDLEADGMSPEEARRRARQHFGTVDAVKKAAKAYRVYFTKTDDSKDQYLVDHSIIHYLLNPKGDFETFFGKNASEDDIANGIVDKVEAYFAKQE